MLFCKRRLSGFRRRIKNERGFTLIETVISLGVIALISNVFLAGVMSSNVNSEVANVVSYMDKLTTQAKEVFQSNPNEVIDGSAVSGDKYTPYSDYGMQYSRDPFHTGDVKTVAYTKYFSNDLNVDISILPTDPEVVYKAEILFTPSEVTQVDGFSFETQKYIMEASVYKKQGASFSKDAIYTRNFEFDQIQIKSIPMLKRNIEIEFDANGGKINLDGVATGDGAYTQKYYKGESIYSQNIITGSKSDETFIGWSEEQSGSTPELIDPVNYAVTANKKLYAQYLAKGDYRVDFRIKDDENWANYEFNKSDVISFEKTFADKDKKPIVKEIDSKITNMFQNNIVSKRGHKFDGWVDSKGDEVLETTKLEKPYLSVYPKWTELVNGRTEVLSLNMKLDLNDVEVDKKSYDGTTRLYALYPFTKMEYSLDYEPSSDEFSIKQVERITDPHDQYYGLLGSYKDGDILSEKTFNMYDANPKFYFESKGKKYTKLTDYIKDNLIDKDNPSFTIDDITLNVDIPTFELDAEGYYRSTTSSNEKIAYSELRNSSGASLSIGQAQTLFQQNPGLKEPSFVFAGGKPIADTKDIVKLNELVQKICNQPEVYQDNFINNGYLSYWSNSDKGYRTSRPENGGGISVPAAKDMNARDVKKVAYKLNYHLPLSLAGNVEATVSTYDVMVTQYVDFVNNKLMAEVSVRTTFNGLEHIMDGWTNQSIFKNGNADKNYARFIIGDYYNAENNSFAYLQSVELGVDYREIFAKASLPAIGINKPISKVNITVNRKFPKITDADMDALKAKGGKNNLYNSFLKGALVSDKTGQALLDLTNESEVRNALKEIFNGRSMLPFGGTKLSFSEQLESKDFDMYLFSQRGGYTGQKIDRGEFSGVQIGDGLLGKDLFDSNVEYFEFVEKCNVLSDAPVNGNSFLSSRCFGTAKEKYTQEETYINNKIIKVTYIGTTDMSYTYKTPDRKLVPLNTFADVAGPGRNYLPPFIRCYDK